MKFRWYQRSLSLLVALVMLVQLMPGQCFAVGTDVFVDSTDIGDIIEESTKDAQIVRKLVSNICKEVCQIGNAFRKAVGWRP